MKRLFAVTRARGPAWKATIPMEEQDGWRPHADFMNSLQDESFVVLGGPLDGTSEVLLIVRADSTEQIYTRLERDPWGPEMLFVVKVAAWTLRLGRLD